MRVLVTGSSGLVGSAIVKRLCAHDIEVVGVDNNSRGHWFGSDGDVSNRINHRNYSHIVGDICDNSLLERIFFRPLDVIIHCAAQPSHDKSAEIPLIDFKINALATVSLLEFTRQQSPEALFIFVSTNKVYGENPDKVPLVELPLRYSRPGGVNEGTPLDNTLHSPFGVSKAAADLMVQEYGLYYGLKTVCFRCGCITGEDHRGVEMHGFLNYLCRCFATSKPYVIYGHGGKQVRDNIHADDLARAFEEVILNHPKPGSVYNMGGGVDNSCSILEAMFALEKLHGKEIVTFLGPARKGDHICYYTDYSKFQADYPNWRVQISLEQIFGRIYDRCSSNSNL